MIKSNFTAAIGLFALAATTAFATGSSNADLGVSASVADNCIISTSPLAFGAYDPIFANATTDLTETGTVSVTCTTGATAKIRLGQGLNHTSGSDAAPARKLKSGTDVLSYFLYQPDGTTVWGNTTGTGVTATADGDSHDFTVNGTITAGQNVPAHADYADTVVATVDF